MEQENVSLAPNVLEAFGYFEKALAECGWRDEKGRIKDLQKVKDIVENQIYPELLKLIFSFDEVSLNTESLIL